MISPGVIRSVTAKIDSCDCSTDPKDEKGRASEAIRSRRPPRRQVVDDQHPEIEGVTQARRLAEAGQAAAEYIALSEDLALSEVEVNIVSVDVNGMDVHAAGELVEQLRTEVRALEGLIAQLTSATARKLIDDDVPLRDIAEVLGVSHQRVAQITRGTERPARFSSSTRTPSS